MNIVVTDGFTLNPGDLSWEAIAALGNFKVYDRTASAEIVERCIDATIVLTNKVPFSRETLQQLPQLKMIGVLATGYNIIDLVAAKELGIKVYNVPDYGTDSVAQHTFALILEFASRVGLHSSSVTSAWPNAQDFCYNLAPLTELKGKVLGLIGLGNIGKKVAEIAKVFGMKVYYYSRHQKDTDVAIYAGLEEIFKMSDFISLHLPLNNDSQGMVNRGLLSVMQAHAVLINTSRGALVNEDDLADFLNHDQIGGAALDVLCIEPPAQNNPLLSAKNCIITPHIAWTSKEARERIMETTLKNINSYLNGESLNLVN